MRERILFPWYSRARVVQALVLVFLLGSCAATGNRPEYGSQAGPEPEPVSVATPEPVSAESDPGVEMPEQYLSGDMMFDILLGEIAGQRGAMGISVDRYLQAAMDAQDPRVAERAVQIASFAKQYDAALRAAKRWVVLDGGNLDARKTLTALAVQQGDLDEVVLQMDHMLRHSADPEESFRMVTVVLARHSDRQAAMDAAQQLSDRYPGNSHAWLALSRLAVVAGDLDTALRAADRALELRPDAPAAIILKAQVLVGQERQADATGLLDEAVNRQPGNTEMLFAYGRILLEGGDLEGAKQQFRRVAASDAGHADALYSLALLELETGNFRVGEKHLRQLLELNQHVQNAYYYLGYATLEQGRNDAALDWYLKVESGDYWTQAQLQAAGIMAGQGEIARMQDHMRAMRQKHPELVVQLYLIEGQVLTDAGMHRQAYELYEKALEYNPDNVDLLYSCSLAAEKVDRLDITERYIRQILEKDPDNVRALNALGYTLADRTDRYQEALQYISRAYEKEPDDPAIIDSMGWVHFRLGDLDKAHQYLLRAWQLSRDSEIGAHLGEVLWMRGEREAAREIWEASRQVKPDNPVLLEVINRLNP